MSSKMLVYTAVTFSLCTLGFVFLIPFISTTVAAVSMSILQSRKEKEIITMAEQVLHDGVATVFWIAVCVLVIALLGYAALLYIAAQRKKTQIVYRDRNKVDRAKCADTCMNYDGECAEKHHKRCRRYEPKPNMMKVFNIKTGEIEHIRVDSPCLNCTKRVGFDCAHHFLCADMRDPEAERDCNNVERCVYNHE